MLWTTPLDSSQTLIFYISRHGSLSVSSCGRSGPCCWFLWLAPFLLSIFQKEPLRTELIAHSTSSSSSPNTEDWRPYVATPCLLHSWPQISLSRIISFPPCARSSSHVKILTAMRQPVSAVAQAVSSTINSPIFHLVKSCRANTTLPAKSCWSPTPTLAGFHFPQHPQLRAACDCTLYPSQNFMSN